VVSHCCEKSLQKEAEDIGLYGTWDLVSVYSRYRENMVLRLKREFNISPAERCASGGHSSGA